MRTLFKTLIISASAAALTCTNALAQTIVIKAQKAVTNSSLGTIDNSTVLIENGIVKAIGVNADYQSDQVISGDQYWVTPGIFSPITNLGLVEVGAVSGTNDINASDMEGGLGLTASDSFNPNSTSVAVSRVGGITYAGITHSAGKTIFGGLGFVNSTNGNMDFDSKSRFIYVQLGESGARKAGGSRSASIGYLRSALNDAANAGTRYTNAGDHGEVLNRYEARLLSQALSGSLPLVIATDRASDILSILKLKRNRLNIIIVGATEGWMVADELAAAGVAVIIDPVENLPYSFEDIGSRLDNAKRLHDAGVTTAFMTRTATGGGAHNLRLLTQHAGNAVTNGLSWDDAFKAITLTPASLFGKKELGTLKAGQTANLVVWDGDPLEVTSAPVAVFIDGKQQSLTSRQTKLRDKYHPTTPNKPLYGYNPK